MNKTKKLSDLDVFELNEMLILLEKMRERYDKECLTYGLNAIQNENMLTSYQRSVLVKRRLIIGKYNEIMELIENKILNDYVKED